jgi:Protein of unknown function (DUF998)
MSAGVDMPNSQPVLDRGAAVTRSLLGWGVVAGLFFLVVGIVLGSVRPGFEFRRHALSLLMLGDLGWIQRTNFALCGLMVIAAGAGVLRAIRSGRGLAIGALVIIAGTMLALSAVFTPDPMGGFPPGSVAGSPTISGMFHMLCGAIEFVAIAGAALAHAMWSRSVGHASASAAGLALAVGTLGGFAAGAALAQHATGIALLWFAVICQWAWLALACCEIYRWSPHPLGAGR